jgi:hypothetical protein
MRSLLNDVSTATGTDGEVNGKTPRRQEPVAARVFSD